MNQKFINLSDKTQKKQPLYQSQPSKRFIRKRSTQSDKSIDSKRTSKQSKQSNYFNINNATQSRSNNLTSQKKQQKNLKVHLNIDDYSQNLIKSIMLCKQITPVKPKYSRVRNDKLKQEIDEIKQFNIDNYGLMAQLQVRNKQIQVLMSQNKSLKLRLDQQKNKDKKIEEQKIQISKQLIQKIKQINKLLIDNKKLIQQKKILIKQIQFLQKINYDQKTRNIQSYKEKYLQKEIQQLRKKININKSDLERQLQDQIIKISNQKYNIQNINKAIKLANQTLIKQLENTKNNQKLSIFSTDEYIKLRDKYKMCLDAYKTLKLEYCELQKKLNQSLTNIPQNILNPNSQLSILLSSSSSEASLCLDKENKNTVKKNENIMARTLNMDSCTPIKISLSPQNRMDKSSSFELSPKKNVSSPKNTPLLSPKNTPISKNTSKTIFSVLEKKKSTPTSYRYKSQINSTNKLRIVENVSNFSKKL